MKKLLLLAGLFVALQMNAQTVNQKIDLKKGNKYNSVNKIEMVITQEVMGQVMEVFVNSNTTNLIDVKENSGNAFEIASSLTHFQVDMDAMGQQMNLNSNNAADLENPAAAQFKGLLNVPNNYSLDKTGKIIAVKKNTPDMDDGMGNFGSIGEVEQEGQVFSVLANLPEEGVKVGGTWNETVEVEGVLTNNTYTLKEVKGDIGVVDMVSDISMNRQMQQQGMDMIMNLKGKGAGQYSFNIKTGLIISRSLNTNSSGTIDVMGQSIPMSIETKMQSNVESN